MGYPRVTYQASRIMQIMPTSVKPKIGITSKITTMLARNKVLQIRNSSGNYYRLKVTFLYLQSVDTIFDVYLKVLNPKKVIPSSEEGKDILYSLLRKVGEQLSGFLGSGESLSLGADYQSPKGYAMTEIDADMNTALSDAIIFLKGIRLDQEPG